MAAAKEADPWLFGPQVAEVLGIQPRTWRKYVETGYAPKPDDADEDRPLNRRMPRWRTSTITAYKARFKRPGQGRRTDLSPEKKLSPREKEILERLKSEQAAS